MAVRWFPWLPVTVAIYRRGSPHQGRKAFTLQTLPAAARGDDHSSVAKAAGFSLHAGVASEAHEREKLERLCRTITRPAVSTERLSLTGQRNIRYRLKTPSRDGTTDVVLLRASCPPPFGAACGYANRSRRFCRTAGFHGVLPCAPPLRGSLRLCKSAILPICHGPTPWCRRRASISHATMAPTRHVSMSVKRNV